MIIIKNMYSMSPSTCDNRITINQKGLAIAKVTLMASCDDHMTGDIHSQHNIRDYDTTIIIKLLV